ncbi:MAG: ribosome biogenesis GTPase Der [Anaerolineae bacterium]|nr:ribosome biogenesis GTPase Der [Anaerolineae bacterium]
MPKPIVALVGRPNVGKSTLFNRLIGQRRAIVEDLPGTTRDRLYGETEWNGVVFTVVDTGGLEIVDSSKQRGLQDRPAPLSTASAGLIEEIRAQAEVAIAEADVIVLLVDALDGLTPADEDIAQVLRRAARPVVVVANKADNEARRQAVVEFYALGLGEIYPISALHGTGVGDLLDEIVAALPPAPSEEEEPEAVKIALVGRPNVGKSSLLNRLLGEERAIVSPVPGTTRDSIDTYLTWEGQPLLLIDTAGIRRRGRIEQGIEKYSVLRAVKAISRADVALLLLDAQDVVTAQDAHVAGYILDENRSVVVLVNKWDVVEKDTYTMDAYTQRIRAELKFLDFVPVLFISALTGQRVNKILPLALQVCQERVRRIPTGELNRLVEEIKVRHPPPHKGRRQLKLMYATQAGVDPPTFVFFVNDARLVHFSYERYIENQIRRRYNYLGTPIKLVFRSRKEKS